PTKPQNEPITPKQNGPECQILEKAVLASLEEQRRSRRWVIFFKTLTFIYLLFIIVLMGKGCSTTKVGSTASSSSAHLAVVDIMGTIDASSNRAVTSEDPN
ncbi:S49 family peptidase, partial [Acinetobacter baumannii]|nr:S49 family peptidase [Acinetobacter baumannii]